MQVYVRVSPSAYVSPVLLVHSTYDAVGEAMEALQALPPGAAVLLRPPSKAERMEAFFGDTSMWHPQSHPLRRRIHMISSSIASQRVDVSCSSASTSNRRLAVKEPNRWVR